MNLAEINAFSKSTLVEILGIQFDELTEGHVKGQMPVNQNTCQPMGKLHGGASAAFAETLASVGSLCSMPEGTRVSGVELSISHLHGVSTGNTVQGSATCVKKGSRLHIWQIEIAHEEQIVAVARCTVMVG